MRADVEKLLTLAWPIVISRATQTVVGLADALMVAHLGALALAATTVGALDVFLVLILPMGTVSIVGSFAAQLTGRGDATGARRFAHHGLWIAVMTQLAAALVIAGLPGWIARFSIGSGDPLAFLPYDAELQRTLTTYLRFRLGSAGAAIGIEALAAYYGGIGRTRVPMIANVAAMVLNVLFNWVLIDGHLGAPAMGVAGAALASSLATTTAFVGLIGYFVLEGRTLARAPSVDLRHRLRELGRVLRFGLPSGLNWALEFLAYAYFANVVVAGLGTVHLAALNAVMQLNSVAFMPAFGIASAGAILVGQAIGEQQRDRVPRLVGTTTLVAATWQVMVGLVYVVAAEPLFSPFPTGEEAGLMMEIGVRMLMLSAAWQLFDAAGIVLSESLRAAGDTVWPLVFRIGLAWLVFVPGTIATVRTDGPFPGDVIAVGWMVLYIALLSVVLLLRFASGAWRKLELIEPSVDEPGPDHASA